MAVYTEDRDVVKNHFQQAAARLMKMKFEGSAKFALTALNIAAQLDEIETEPKPPATPRTPKK